MKIIYSDAHKGHGGALEMRGEAFVPMAECPERMEVILAALSEAGLRDVEAPKLHGLAEAARIHDPDFLTFLETAYPLWEKRHGASRAVFARVLGCAAWRKNLRWTTSTPCCRPIPSTSFPPLCRGRGRRSARHWM